MIKSEGPPELLTVGQTVYSLDQRISIAPSPRNWKLVITNVTQLDSGPYLCQLATHPPSILLAQLQVKHLAG